MDKKSGKSGANNKVIQTLATIFSLLMLLAIYVKVIFL